MDTNRATDQQIYKNWEEKGYFKPNPAYKKSFVLMIPPPNVTGVLHMGHGLNNSLQDILARYHRMKGESTLWVPGTDHAGIATQHVVERRLKEKGQSKHTLGREKFVEETWKVSNEHHDIIVNQLRQIGSSCDWSRERFTLDEGLSEAVKEVFVNLYEKGLIYQGEYLTNWCSTCGTALADDEVEYSDDNGFLYYVKYDIVDSDEKFIIATSRPETIFGDVAIAFHPEDERYKHLIDKQAIVPMVGRVIPFITDSYVDKDFGTASLKVTPAHADADYEIGLKHKLEIINVLNPDGKLNHNVPQQFQGLTVKEARKAVVAHLEEQGLLLKKEAVAQRVGHCYRCNTVIEPYMSKQWFVKMSGMAEKALKALEQGDIKFYPERWGNTYTHWMKSIRDWCISRQLWWGHRIPAWHCEQCGHITVSRTDVSKCEKCGSARVTQDNDVLDTWFSSWLWPFSTLGWPQKTADLEQFYPTSALVTAYDIIFFWVARMVMAGLEFTGQVPFKDIYITPLVRDKQGRKMSKSLGNGIDPLEIVADYGADALKFTIAYLSSQSQDLNLDKESFKLGAGFANKIRNAGRYIMMNAEGFVKVENPNLTTLDKWIKGRLNLATKAVDKAMTEFRFDDMAHAVYDYFWKDFCDWYIEGSKLSLYSQDPIEKNRALTVAFDVLEASLRLLHPFLPFITEELWLQLPSKTGDSIMISSYPLYKEEANDKTVDKAFETLQNLIGSVRTLRAESGIPLDKKLELALLLNTDYNPLIQEQMALIKALVKAEKLEFVAVSPEGWASTHGLGYSIFTPALQETAEQKAKKAKELEKLLALKASALVKLNNTGFTDKAPPSAIEKEKAKLKEAEEGIAKLGG